MCGYMHDVWRALFCSSNAECGCNFMCVSNTVCGYTGVRGGVGVSMHCVSVWAISRCECLLQQIFM